MTRPRDWASLRAQLARYIGPDLAADHRFVSAIASGARWSANDLYGAKSYAAQQLAPLAGSVRSISIDPMANAVEVGVNPADVPAAKRMLHDADVPAELVHVVGETVCRDSMAWAVEVVLADSASDRPVNDSALVVLQGPMAADSAKGNPTDPAWPIVVGNGVWGEFELSVARAGYKSRQVHVVVPTDGCHPVTQRLRLVLVPSN